MDKKVSTKPARWMLQPWNILFLILVQFLVQFLISVYLYTYVARVETDLLVMRNQEFFGTEKLIRRKRSSALPVTEDNKLSDASRVCNVNTLSTTYFYYKLLKNNRKR